MTVEEGRALHHETGIAFAPHDELLTTCPLYNQLWTQQVGDSITPALASPDRTTTENAAND